jgi:membrane protein involved in colicin uptake
MVLLAIVSDGSRGENTMSEKTWPTANEMQLGWTAKYPRPTVEAGHHPATLEYKQKTWDEAEALRVKYAKRSAEIQAEKEAKIQAERDRLAAEREAARQTQNAETEAMLQRRYLAAGGSVTEWEAEKATIVSEHRRRAVAEAETADERARREHSRIYSSF